MIEALESAPKIKRKIADTDVISKPVAKKTRFQKNNFNSKDDSEVVQDDGMDLDEGNSEAQVLDSSDDEDDGMDLDEGDSETIALDPSNNQDDQLEDASSEEGGIQEKKVITKNTKSKSKAKGRRRVSPINREAHASTAAVFKRSTKWLGINLWDAVPEDIEVEAVGKGLNWPWTHQILKPAQLALHCPAFRNNVDLFRFAVDYAISCRSGLKLPIPSANLQSATIEKDKEEEEEEEGGGEEDDDESYGPPMQKKFVKSVAEEMKNAILGLYSDFQQQALLYQQKKDRLNELVDPMFEKLMQPKPKHVDPIINFLTKDAFASAIANGKSSRSKKKSPTHKALLAVDFENIANAWDAYAKKNNKKPCEYYRNKALSIRCKSSDQSELNDWLDDFQRTDSLRLYGSDYQKSSTTNKKVAATKKGPQNQDIPSPDTALTHNRRRPTSDREALSRLTGSTNNLARHRQLSTFSRNDTETHDQIQDDPSSLQTESQGLDDPIASFRRQNENSFRNSSPSNEEEMNQDDGSIYNDAPSDDEVNQDNEASFLLASSSSEDTI